MTKFHMKAFICLISINMLVVCFVMTAGAAALKSVRTSEAVDIDGKADEPGWGKAPALIARDSVAAVDLEVRSMYSDKYIYMLLRFKDPDENRLHKSWVWDPSAEVYKVGHDREDICVVKWFMEFEPGGVSLYAGYPQVADIWYWKAGRTDKIGFADDKIQYLESITQKRATTIVGANGTSLYLTRKGDAGDAAYISNLVVDYTGDSVPRFDNVPPTGSRADVMAKGEWSNGVWTVEFKRALDTGHEDDLALNPGTIYTFGVSRLEIAGRSEDKTSSMPLYGAGDIISAHTLEFDQQ
ncbi:ethylbenzene dehydrogenase-related protein [Desulfosediminicola flagellatus]|uniref:ethylbenzene dehydrogenase-related protein n=1 Tax=Desulfosediminicola flagellatus TaxID=2569541 RepID=UPI00142F06F7|nr:ethylbenzene dehydrogenase-related protein [Desulfosediminicola flagellatus]